MALVQKLDITQKKVSLAITFVRQIKGNFTAGIAGSSPLPLFEAVNQPPYLSAREAILTLMSPCWEKHIIIMYAAYDVNTIACLKSISYESFFPDKELKLSF